MRRVFLEAERDERNIALGPTPRASHWAGLDEEITSQAKGTVTTRKLLKQPVSLLELKQSADPRIALSDKLEETEVRLKVLFD